jgi:hypothetical protein
VTHVADDVKFSFRAKTYKNRKDESRVQVSGLQADFVKLAKDDEDASAAFKKQVVEAIKSK